MSSPPVFRDWRRERRKLTRAPFRTGFQRRLGLFARRFTMRRASCAISSSSWAPKAVKSFSASDSISLAPGTLTGSLSWPLELLQLSRKNSRPLVLRFVERRRTIELEWKGSSLSTSFCGNRFQKASNSSSKMGKSSSRVESTLRKLRKTSSRSLVSIKGRVVTATTTSEGVTARPCSLRFLQNKTRFSISGSVKRLG